MDPNRDIKNSGGKERKKDKVEVSMSVGWRDRRKTRLVYQETNYFDL